MTREGRGGGAPAGAHPSEHRHLRGAINRARRLPIGRYSVDLAHHESRLIIELDGGQHAADDGLANDADRTAWLEGRGYRVLRFWNPEVQENLEGVVETILAAVAPPPGPSPVEGEGEVL